jgi:hypothetical protein
MRMLVGGPLSKGSFDHGNENRSELLDHNKSIGIAAGSQSARHDDTVSLP